MIQRDRDTQTVEEEGRILGYRVIYERTDNGWSAYTPDLPGLGGAAATREEMEQLIREAIPLYLETLEEDRQQRPWLYGEPDCDTPSRG